MSTRSDAAAQAAIGAAARELHLPTVRDQAQRLAEIAVRERHTHLGFLAEVLSADPTSSKPAPSPTGCAPARPPTAARRPTDPREVSIMPSTSLDTSDAVEHAASSSSSPAMTVKHSSATPDRHDHHRWRVTLGADPPASSADSGFPDHYPAPAAR